MNARASILQGQRPQAGHEPALQHIRSALRAVSLTYHSLQSTEISGSCLSNQSTELTIVNLQEVARITDQRVEFSLRSADAAAGKWLLEDPPLSTVQRISGSE
jgi:hypothetical protein